MYNDKALKKLSARTEGERKRAAYWLVSNGEKQDLEILKTMIDDENPKTRESVAFAMGGVSKLIGDKSATKILLQRYDLEEDLAVKEAIVSALCDVTDENSLHIYNKYLEADHNEILRFRIAETLEELASPKSIPTLAKIINGDNTDTLKIACRKALEKIAIKEKTTVDALLKKHPVKD
jgi:HEAT repeat protein